MAENLRDRLKRIQLVKHNERNVTHTKKNAPCFNENISLPDWTKIDSLTLKREIAADEIILSYVMPETVNMVISGMYADTAYEKLLFFDLETTGLSGGAGTVAFLAAFGRLVYAGDNGNKTSKYTLRITQYLLLDYPGEYNFIRFLLEEITPDCTIVSYNGKCFDSQILKTRCLMNGIKPPEYFHADLLYSARRLWKRILPGCRQADIEYNILGIDRAGDTPGEMAPDIWFSFLRTGDTGPLLGICDHNRRDIYGLALIFRVMAEIAGDPVLAADKINFDLDALSVRWHEITCGRRHTQHLRLGESGKKLLHFAAERECPRAQLLYAKTLLKAGKCAEGRKWLLKAASADNPPVRAAAFRALAIDSERRMKNAAEALELTERGMSQLPPDSSIWPEFDRRSQRLRKKLEIQDLRAYP